MDIVKLQRSESGHEKKGNLICSLHMKFLQTYGKPDSKSTVDCSCTNKTCRGEDGEYASFLHTAFWGEISSVIGGFSFQSWLWCCALRAQSSQTRALLRHVSLLQHSIPAGISRLFCCRGGNPTEEQAAAWSLSAVPLPGSTVVRVGRSSSVMQPNPCWWHVLVALLTCAALLAVSQASSQAGAAQPRACCGELGPQPVCSHTASSWRGQEGSRWECSHMTDAVTVSCSPAVGGLCWKTPFVGCCLFMCTQDPHRPLWTREAFHTEAFRTKLDSFSFCGYHMAFMINIGDKI